ncbi:CcdB family protein [Comamonas flocculans]|uniref:Toxin CcdB n=1 Tax=Comamonas flocculans TaxID=2597701 RepID=A0A5B8RX41_9BURK|nr:CcdB family protein [Comamonas flocculans]QEA14070.1 plasmid maintenance protein CcdB [Comamonas flocculans]
MTQFDACVNPQPGSRQFIPCVLDVQSALTDQLGTRLVVPLSRVGVKQVRLPTKLCPVLEVVGEPLVLMPHLAAPMPVRLLKQPVGSLASRAAEITSAMDEVLSGF